MELHKNYKERLKEFLEPFLREEWMSNEDWETILGETVSHMGGWDKFEKDVEVGIRNGFSFEKQLEIVSSIIGVFKNDNEM